MLHSINKEFLDGLALVVPLGGGKPNWTMLAAILVYVAIACSVQIGFALPELLYGALIVPYVLLAMSHSNGRVARGKFCGYAE
ncbi:hypothetical protein [Xanthomonas graminis]|uniref:Putative membrane protein n=1 Tax=Xanthomonas graminis pv. phlei TaxID=487906 RepID=A0A0K3A1A1_9XANT|nr:hypothetical protein [Xanthomonas translucens]UKE65110.1 hypothetical protein KM547_15620 [Xanthomonas translucens pv. phlei]UKE74094.1 hypothetical protein KFS85_03970 [Xanthomonas translucens pv. phleipratensis]CTP91861.1 putative membrane protein [Xanthomonas translucens pv. phlei]